MAKANGRVDRKTREHAGPAEIISVVEELLVRIWTEMLGARVGVWTLFTTLADIRWSRLRIYLDNDIASELFVEAFLNFGAARVATNCY